MFAEFELAIHEEAERGGVLTGERFDEIYLGLLRQYHGHDSVMTISDEFAVEWAAIPHFYRHSLLDWALSNLPRISVISHL